MFCFGSLLGFILEVFLEPKWRPKAWKSGSQKSSKNMSKSWSIFDRFWGPFGVPNGARKVQIRTPNSDLASSRVLRGSRGSIWHLFLIILGPILRWFLCAFLTYRSTCVYVFETLTLAFRLVLSVPVMVLCPVVNSLRMLELLGQVCLVVVRTALRNLACWVRLSNYWIGLLVWLFVSGLIVLVWSALVQAVLFSLVWSVLAGLFWFGTFDMYCSGLFSRVPSWQVLAWFAFSRVPSCVGSDLFWYVLLCSSLVNPFFLALVW